MTKHSRIFVFISLMIMSVLVSACTGAAPVESWPGITVLEDGGEAYVSFTNQIYRVDLQNGAETWRFAADPEPKVNFYAPPAISEDGNLLVGTYNFLFYNINPEANPPVVWSFSEAKDRYIASPLIMGDLVYAPSADGYLYALRLQDGGKAKEFKAEHSLWSTPVTDGENLIVASMDHHVYSLDPVTLQPVWESDDLGGPIVAAPALSPEGILYTGIFGSKTEEPSRASRLIALDSANGKELWSVPMHGWVWSTPLLVDGVLYLGDTEGYFYAVDAQQGKLLWTYPQVEPAAKTSILGAPAVIGDKVYFGNEAGVVTILNRADGTGPLEIAVGGQIYSNLVVTGDTILFAPVNYEEAILVAMNPDGTIRWKFLPTKEAPVAAP
jgi:outer membrane protein assembly factor BamB